MKNFLTTILHLLYIFGASNAVEQSTVALDEETCFTRASTLMNTTKFPSEVIPLTRASFHEVLENSITIVAFYGDESTPGWLATSVELQTLAKLVNETFSGNSSDTVARIVVASLAEKNAERLYRQYAQTTNNNDKIFIYMFLPQTPDLPLKITWSAGKASSFAVVQELAGLEYRLALFDSFIEEFENLIIEKKSLKPLLEKAKKLLETTESPETTLRGMKYLRIVQNVEEKGIGWIAKQIEAHKLALSAGRCGSKRKCIRGWQNKQLLVHFAGNVIDDAYADLENKEEGTISRLHHTYDIPTPVELLNKTTTELLLLKQSLRTRENDLQLAYEDKGADIIDLMREMGNISPSITKQRLREAYLRAQRNQIEKVSGKYFVQYAEMVHRFLFTKEIQGRIDQLFERANTRERGERARDRLATKEFATGPLM